MAPPADPTTEGALRALKRKIMNCFKNHRSSNQDLVEKDDLKALNDLRSDPELIVKRSDKCKGFVLLPRETYLHKKGGDYYVTVRANHEKSHPTT